MKFWEAMKAYDEGETITDGGYILSKENKSSIEYCRSSICFLLEKEWSIVKYETHDSYHAILRDKETRKVFLSDDTYVDEKEAIRLIRENYMADIEFIRLLKEVPELVIPKKIEV